MRSYYFLFTLQLLKCRQSILSLLILSAFLCAVLSHSAHSELIQDNTELQQCKLCQHSIDSPPSICTVKLTNIVEYIKTKEVLNVTYREIPLYLIPQLRAPPKQ